MDTTTKFKTQRPHRKPPLKGLRQLTAANRRTIAKLLISASLIGLASSLTLTEPLRIALFILAYLLTGGDVLWTAIRHLVSGQVFDENFLMSLATLGAIGLQQYQEAVAVMLFYQIGDLFEDIAVNQSKRSISSLLALKPTTATMKTATGWKTVAPTAVQVADVILVRAGEKIPLDGTILRGTSSLNIAALTGESMPRAVSVGDTALSGAVNGNGLLTIQVTKPYADSTVARILDLVEHASSQKAPTENFITTFAKIYTPIVVTAAAILAVVPPLILGDPWFTWLARALVFLVISCPCALVISIPLGFFGGIGAAAKRGVLIKGSNYLEALTKIDTVVFDKTGTLTQGRFQVVDVQTQAGLTDQQLLGLASAAEQHSTHPIATSIQAAYAGDLADYTVTNAHETAGKGLTARVNGLTVTVGNAQAMAAHHLTVPTVTTPGTKSYVAADGQFLGTITIADQLKADAAQAITQLKASGIQQTIMLTGDNATVGQHVAQALNMDAVQTDLLPGDKVTAVADLMQAGHRVAFVGDGINDTPVLTRADVGIAMGGLGSDAAIEAADIVIMGDEPAKVATTREIAKRTHQIVWQNIIFAIGIKVIFLALGAFGLAGLWEAVFADVGVTILAVLNSLRVMRLRR